MVIYVHPCDCRKMAPGCLSHLSTGKATAFGEDIPDYQIPLLLLLHRSLPNKLDCMLWLSCL